MRDKIEVLERIDDIVEDLRDLEMRVYAAQGTEGADSVEQMWRQIEEQVRTVGEELPPFLDWMVGVQKGGQTSIRNSTPEEGDQSVPEGMHSPSGDL